MSSNALIRLVTVVACAAGAGAVRSPGAPADTTTNAVQDIVRLRASAEQGDPGAQNNLGRCYWVGDGVAKNATEAAMWWRKAAEQGQVAAQFNLGLSYASGKGLVKEPAEAARWYRRAADQGYAEAQFILGQSYLAGAGVAMDKVEAYRWFLLAGKSGLALAGERCAQLAKELTPAQVNMATSLVRDWQKKRAPAQPAP